MPTITRDSIMTLEDYAKARQDFRAQVMSHKKNRKVSLGKNVTLIFEDELTIRYQIQEMLRAEKIFEEKGIVDEIEAYKALIPDGRNWKATMMIEYPDPVVRADKLTKLVGIENKVWAKIENYAPVFAIADEDLDRATEEKTSAVHFLRFELNQDMIRALHKGASLSMGIDHPIYLEQIKQVDKLVSNSLIDDLDR
jgi:glycosyltransferase involved in cell wall biosynthesis